MFCLPFRIFSSVYGNAFSSSIQQVSVSARAAAHPYLEFSLISYNLGSLSSIQSALNIITEGRLRIVLLLSNDPLDVIMIMEQIRLLNLRQPLQLVGTQGKQANV